jgi:glycosyltransferase involved in cell wall biosynthesis
MGGVETYFRELVRHLPTSDSDDCFSIYTQKKYHTEFSAHPSVSMASSEEIYRRPHLLWFLNALLRRIGNQDTYTRSLRKIACDVIHYPFTTIDPPVMDRPTVLTFWDMQHEFYPEFFSRKELHQRLKTYRNSTHLATRVIVSASYTKDCLIHRYGIDSSKIDVVHTGFSPNYRVIAEDKETQRIRIKYGLHRPFMYYPAATWPHKNHTMLLAAIKVMIDRKQFDGQLVLSGGAMNNDDVVKSTIVDYGLTNHVKILGYLPYSELPYLFNMARMLVFPSLFEGFGIPLVEAMACGCPVTAADCTSIPEVLGEAGKLFDPKSQEDMITAISESWQSDFVRGVMRQKGLDRANQFSWGETAKKTKSVYRNSLK